MFVFNEFVVIYKGFWKLLNCYLPCIALNSVEISIYARVHICESVWLLRKHTALCSNCYHEGLPFTKFSCLLSSCCLTKLLHPAKVFASCCVISQSNSWCNESELGFPILRMNSSQNGLWNWFYFFFLRVCVCVCMVVTDNKSQILSALYYILHPPVPGILQSFL